MTLSSQNYSGEWKGIIYQEETRDTFNYSLSLQQQGDEFSGVSASSTLDGQSNASFTLTGVVNAENIIIQEIAQTSPKSPKWCLKYLTMTISMEGDRVKMVGDWKANGCIPGKVILYNDQIPSISFVEKTVTEEAPFSLSGKWTGYLNQSDRDYGFYFEIDMKENKVGESYIVSEGNGGSAYHQLGWEFDNSNNTLKIKEDHVKRKTEERWPWCIKNLNLQLTKKEHIYVLEGKWNGYIEGYNQKTGSCAPGNIYLERPIEFITKTVTDQIQANNISLKSNKKNTVVNKNLPYEEEKKRKVKVQRIIEVQRPDLKIKVWDNGTVDGDVVTIFLNGKLLFENYRVTKHKYTKIVTLNEEDNYLILHAEDLGKISPNTVAVSIDDGAREQIIILSSNLDESGAVMIKQFKLE